MGWTFLILKPLVTNIDKSRHRVLASHETYTNFIFFSLEIASNMDWTHPERGGSKIILVTWFCNESISSSALPVIIVIFGIELLFISESLVDDLDYSRDITSLTKEE